MEEQRAAHKRWVEQHAPEEIAIANTARASLRRQEDRKKGKATKFPVIHDERAVKRGMTAFLQFSINRHASGDFKNIQLGERAKLIGQEWKALNEEEKKVSFYLLSVLIVLSKEMLISDRRSTITLPNPTKSAMRKNTAASTATRPASTRPSNPQTPSLCPLPLE